ncbi:MAG: LapA family protein [Alphaproteobacteria bacterium]|nr:LapA family protein [Alphaproteobacteria bacterium]
MLNFVFYVLFVGLVVIFASQNLHVVPVYFLISFQAPLVLVVGVSFFIGFSAAILGVLLQAVKRRKKRTDIVVRRNRF